MKRSASEPGPSTLWLSTPPPPPTKVFTIDLKIFAKNKSTKAYRMQPTEQVLKWTAL